MALAIMKSGDLIDINALKYEVNYAYGFNSIDNPVYMKNGKAYVFHGTHDNTVVIGVSKKVVQFYTEYMPAENIKTNFTLTAEHAMVTDNYGQGCASFNPPYINNCQFDLAGDMLKWFHGDLKERVESNYTNVSTAVGI